jgi:4-amino-4-deoxy-L-arabinose transferase-like glycosyltransferase
MSKPHRRRWLEVLVVISITAAALAVRIYRLDEIPTGLYEDEAAYGVDALAVLDGDRSLFFERNNGREPLFIYWQALLVGWFGATPYTLRLAAALAGAATIPAIYGLARTLFGSTPLPPVWMATWCALFLAFSYWHLSLSRVGFRAITLPLLACITFVFFWRAWPRLIRQERMPWVDLGLCALFLGLTLYTYTAARFIPVLLAGTTLIGLFFERQQQGVTGRGLLALAFVGFVAALVFAPLGFYFVTHLDNFLDRASDISIFSPRWAPEGPVAALQESVVRTALMFVTWPDSNLRHNPAQRPLFDPLLAAWLLVGLAVALVRGRNVAYLFCVLWFGVLALPVLLTAEALPHSLRAIGMLPAAILLIVLGLVWVGQRLPGRLAAWAVWLPLPFFLFSAYIGVRDYFGAWSEPENFRSAFMVDFAQAGQRIAESSSAADLWVLPLSPNYTLEQYSPAYHTLTFMIGGRTLYTDVVAAEPLAATQLTAIAAHRRWVHVLDPTGAEQPSTSAFLSDDIKGIVPFLLEKQGRKVVDPDAVDIGIPYTTYEVQPGTHYLFSGKPVSTSITFGDRVQLVQVDYGRTTLDPLEPVAALAEHQTPAGHPLWALLRWQALTPIDKDLKVSLVLKDEAGHPVGQVDKLLVSDYYPVFRTWEAGERASIYPILPVEPGLPPGGYLLYAKVYEDQNGGIYPAKNESGDPLGSEVLLGTVEITPGAPVTLTPERAFANPPRLAPDLALIGIDLPRTTIAPGETLPVTLYWHAQHQLAADYVARLQLLADDGAVVAEQRSRPGGDRYPTTQWRSGETLRSWMDLFLAPTIPPGSYELVVSLSAGDAETGRLPLGGVEVQGRVRRFDPPPLGQPLPAFFGQLVRLLGIDTPPAITVAPGEELILTLVWQPKSEPVAPLVRFVHLLGAEGRPLAQQDGAPCAGECPAPSWLVDEILVDPVRLPLPADLPSGDYRLVTGWYDPATVTRLEAYDEQGDRLAEDVLELPVRVVVR